MQQLSPLTQLSNQRIEYHEKVRSFEEHSLVFLVRFCSTAVTAVLLIGSILALYFVTDQDARLALVIAFVVLFAIGLSICTGASRDSIFAGTAAYAAVLIVFVSGSLSNRKVGRLGPWTVNSRIDICQWCQNDLRGLQHSYHPGTTHHIA